MHRRVPKPRAVPEGPWRWMPSASPPRPATRARCATSSSAGCGPPCPRAATPGWWSSTSPESNGMSSETLLVDAVWTEDGAEVVASPGGPGGAAGDRLPGVHHLRPRHAVPGDAPGGGAHRRAGAGDPLARAGPVGARRGVLRHGPRRRPGAARRAALHLRRQLGLRRHRGGPPDDPGLGGPGHGRDPLDPADRPRPVLPRSSTSPAPPHSSGASTTGRTTSSGWWGTAGRSSSTTASPG